MTTRHIIRGAADAEATQGLAPLKPRRGCYVTELSEPDIDEAFPVTAMLEGRVAEPAARRATGADFSRLAAIHETLRAKLRRWRGWQQARPAAKAQAAR